MTPRRGLLVAILTLTAISLASGGLGIIFDRDVLLPRQLEHLRSSPPDEIRRAMRDRMARALDLTAEQQDRIDSLTSRNFRGLQAARSSFQPQMDSLIRSLRASMDSVLTPAQRKKLDSLRARDAFAPPGGPWMRGPVLPGPPLPGFGPGQPRPIRPQ